MNECVDKWKQNGIIIRAPINYRFNNPLTMAPKKDAFGNMTLKWPCLDPQHINKLLPDDYYPIPLIKDIFEALAGAVIFTTLDLKSAYHQFLIKLEDQPKTAFTWHHEQLMFMGAPFGLKPMSSKFQWVTHLILRDLWFVLAYIDDIVIFSKYEDDHNLYVIEVIEWLTNAGLRLNLDKCHFFRRQIRLLGFIISPNGILLDPQKLINIDTWDSPTIAKQVMHYLGLFNYFRHHIPLISRLTVPLDVLWNSIDVLKD